MTYASEVPATEQASRFIVRLEGEPLAYLVIQKAFWYATPGRYEARIFIGSVPNVEHHIEKLLELIWSLVKFQEGNNLGIWVQDDKSHYVNVFERCGLVATQRNPESGINPQEFDPSSHLELLPTLEGQGYRFTNLQTLQEEFPDWIKRAYDLEMALMRDVPLPDPWVDIPFESFEQERRSPFFQPATQFYAVHDREWVAVSGLTLNKADPSVMNTGLTGVLPAHRRRGVAKMLKALGLAEARRLGVKLVITDNEESNPMFNLNKELGYHQLFNWVCYERKG